MDYGEESERELNALEDCWEEEYESEFSTSEVDWGEKETDANSDYVSEPWSDNANSEAELEYDDDLSSEDVYENKGDEETDFEVNLQELVELDEEQSSCIGYGSDKTWLEETDPEVDMRSEMSSLGTDLEVEDHVEGSWLDESEINYGEEPEHAHDSGAYYQAEKEESWGYSTNDDQEPRYIQYSGHGQGPEAYLCWEKDMEDWFSLNQVPEEEKANIAEETLTEDAWAYWERESSLRLEYGCDEAAWEEMKQILSDEFVRDQDDNRQHYVKTHANLEPSRWIEAVKPSQKELPKHAYHSHESKKKSIKALVKQQGLQLTDRENEVQRAPSALPLFELQSTQDTRLMEFSKLLMRDVFQGDIPTRLPPQTGIELQFEHVLGAQSLVPSLPLIQFKEEPPDFVRNTLTLNLSNSEIAGLHLTVYIEVPDRLGVLNSGLDMSLLPRKLNLGTKTYLMVRVECDILLSALMLATSLNCFAGANREYRDDQWVKEEPPDVILKVHEELCATTLRIEARHFESNILFFDDFYSMSIDLNDIAYIEEPIKLGVTRSCLDLELLVNELYLGIRGCLMVHTHCQVPLSIMMHLLLAQKAYCFAGARKEFRFDQWTKEKPPDSNIWLFGEGIGGDCIYGSKPRGKVDTTLGFIEIDSGIALAGSVSVLRTKPLEEGGNDVSLETPNAKYQLLVSVETQGAVTSSRAKALEDKISIFMQTSSDGKDSKRGYINLEIAWMIAWIIEGACAFGGGSVWTLLSHGREAHGVFTITQW